MILTSDGSSDGAGGYLSQEQDGGERVIAYFSKIFSESQAKMSATDKELEALRLAVKFFRPYILDRRLRLRVDHRPIVEMAKSKHMNCRLYRIYELLRSFDITVEYIPGTSNVISDALSCVSHSSEEPANSEPVILPEGMRELEISGGGDSLVKAFALTLFGDQMKHPEVRKKLVNQIKKNPTRYNLGSISPPQLRNWEIQGVNLPVEVLEALATAYKVNIILHQAGTFPLLFSAPKPQSTINLVYKDGIHINAVTKEETVSEEVNMLETDIEMSFGHGLTKERIKEWQDADQLIVLIREAIKSSDPFETLSTEMDEAQTQRIPKKIFENCRVIDGILVKLIVTDKQDGEILVPWLPSEITHGLLDETHRALSHVGRAKVLDVAKSSFFSINLTEEVTKVVKDCLQCKMGKTSCGANKAKASRIETKEPYELVAIDLAEFPRSQNGNKYLMLAIDHYSRRAFAKPLRNKMASTIAKEFEYNFIPSFIAVPQRLLSDNGAEFQNSLFKTLLDKYHVKHQTIAPGYPASNGAIERLVGTVKSLLRTTCLEGGEWDEMLPLTLNAYNNTLHKSIKMKPSEVFLDNAARVVLPKRPQHDKSTHETFEIGDKVLKRVDIPSSKTSPRFEPGFSITQVNPGGLTYVIRRQNPKPGQLSLLKAHHNQLRFEGHGEVISQNRRSDKVASAVRTLTRLAEETQRIEEYPTVISRKNRSESEIDYSQGQTYNQELLLQQQREQSDHRHDTPPRTEDGGTNQSEPIAGAAINPCQFQQEPSEESESEVRQVRRSTRNRTRPAYLKYYEN